MNPHPPRTLTAIACLVCLSSPAGAAWMLEPGSPIDIARFGMEARDETSITIEWESPRDVDEIRISAGESAPNVRLEYWGSVWPANGTGGWMRLDDPWNGKWVRVAAERRDDPEDPRRAVFTFPPLAREEWENALPAEKYPEKRPPRHRRTLKVRAVATEPPLPAATRIAVFTGALWREGRFDIEVRNGSDGEQARRLELVNGHILSLESLAAPRSVELDGSLWRAKGPAGGSGGVRAGILYADAPDANSNDCTRVTVRLGGDLDATGFSFVPQDVLAAGVVRIPDLGALVSESARSIAMANDPGPSGAAPRRVRTRLRERAEMTLASALAGMPRLAPAPWVPIGVPSARQEFFVGPAGDWAAWAMSLNTDTGRDAKRFLSWKNFRERPRDKLEAILDTRAAPRFDGGDRVELRRYLEEGHLPLIHAEWRDGSLSFRHSLCAAALLGDYGDDVKRRGDETVVVLTRLTVENTGAAAREAHVSLRFSSPLPVRIEPDGIVQLLPPAGVSIAEGLTPVRARISCDAPAGGGAAGWAI